MLSQNTLKEIDALCRNLVKFFNEIGLETSSSCQGHPKSQRNPQNTMFKFYIDFSKNVKDEDIKNFIKKIGEPYFRFREEIQTNLKGKFVKIYFGGQDFRWRYVVDSFPDYRKNQIAAETDYKLFKILYKK